MLQWRSDLEVVRQMTGAPEARTRSSTMADLRSDADRAVDSFRAARQMAASRRGLVSAALERIDRGIRTDRVEYIDRTEFPARAKERIIRLLHWHNVAIGAYRQLLRVLLPHIERVHASTRAPVRLLELACGSGEATIAIAKGLRKRKLPVHITGSDIVPVYIERAKARAQRHDLPVSFRVLNAFALDELDAGSFDIAFIGQSMHHFTPGQLAMMIAQAQRVAPRLFLGVDGYRSVLLLLFNTLTGIVGSAMAGSFHFLHDALVSARKMYSHAELRLIASIAAPSATVVVRRAYLGYSVVEVAHPYPLALADG